MSRKLKLGLLGLGALTMVGVAFAAAATPGGPRAVKQLDAESIQDVKDKMAFGSEFVLDRLDATDAQKKKVARILEPLADDIVNLKNEGRALREAMKEVLLADDIDRARMESLRKEGLALADRASKLALDTVADLSDVLTPEQKAKVRARMERWHR